MADHSGSSIPSTTDAARTAVSSREGGGGSPPPSHPCKPCEGEGEKFEIDHPVVQRGTRGRPYERKPGDPLYRPLRIYTVDPGTRHSEGAMAVVNVPYEPLKLGKNSLKGSVFHVMSVVVKDPLVLGQVKESVDLNDPLLLLTDGCPASPVNGHFHQQMVYAVASLVYASFRRALGRHVVWGFERKDRDGLSRLRLSPHGRSEHAGAAYNRTNGEVRFGFLTTRNGIMGRAVPDGQAFSCVSHDIVTHEVTHALLDGLRAHFLEPTGPDVLGFHEGFADLIALLHRFSYTEVVRAAVWHSHGKVLESRLVTSIAAEFGRAIGNGDALRGLHQTKKKALEVKAKQPGGSGNGVAAAAGAAAPDPEEVVVLEYSADMGAHAMGEVFVSAVLHAFATVYTRKIERYLRLATGGTGELPRGDISRDLQDVLVEEASQLASQFLDVCIRAIDYCPPVDLELGDFLRAVITADMDLVPDDRWEYREAWIDAFALHKIFPGGVRCMSEDELKWPMVPPPDPSKNRPASRVANPSGDRSGEENDESLVVEALSFTELNFAGDPACAADECEMRRRACVLGQFITEHPDRFGILAEQVDPLSGDRVSLPKVHSVRTSRRVGPDGQVVFDLVAEVTQTREVKNAQLTAEYKPFLFRGGCTVILGPQGEVRYIIRKDVGDNSRVFRQKEFMRGAGAAHVSPNNDDDNVFRYPDAEKVQFSHQHPETQR